MGLKINGATSGSTTITAPATGSDETIELSTALASKRDTTDGYVFKQTVYFTSNGTFTKATYPWLRAIRVKVQGAGAGGRAGSTNNVHAGGGSGGGYAEKFITDIAGLSASVTVTVGAGGAGGSTSGGAGVAGGNSVFDTLTGSGGATPGDTPQGAIGGSATGGDLNIQGGDGMPTPTISVSSWVSSGVGGSSVLGFGGRGGQLNGSSVPSAGTAGRGYGAGGGGGTMNTTTFANGGAGANGIVILELYA
jgi:hypothetical protein